MSHDPAVLVSQSWIVCSIVAGLISAFMYGRFPKLMPDAQNMAGGVMVAMVFWPVFAMLGVIFGPFKLMYVFGERLYLRKQQKLAAKS